ncbi:MAG: [NiFe]-hydrogenase assembly chaperone HybE [Gammaproteobacteria bacterium]
MALTSQDLVDTYRRIAARMQGLPVLNPALEVEAVGFRTWEQHQIGVLITPWFMNLVLIPGPEDEWRDYVNDKATEWLFPAGRCAFHTSRPDGQPLHMSASLFTTVEGFPDQDTARAVAAGVLQSLFEAPTDGRDRNNPGNSDSDALMAKPVSRRDLLRRVTLQGS